MIVQPARSWKIQPAQEVENKEGVDPPSGSKGVNHQATAVGVHEPRQGFGVGADSPE